MSVQTDSSSVPTVAARSEGEDRVRAKAIAMRRRRNQALVNIGIRLASLIVVLALWEIFGARIDQTLFTTPSKIAVAAVDMIASGELWNYLAPSLLVRMSH